MQHVIYTRNSSNSELSPVEIMDRAPAVFTQYKNPDVSDRYAPVSTLDAMEVLRDYGYVPVQAKQARGRTVGAREYGQHLVAFSHQDDLFRWKHQMKAVGDRPEIILYNSHNAKSSVKLFGGFFRAVCSNGLIAGEGFENRMVHYNSTVAMFEEMLKDVATKLPALGETIEMMKTTSLDGDVVWQMAKEAAALRWDVLPEVYEPGELTGSFFTGLTIKGLTNARRSEDTITNLWTTYNKIQENLIRGGAEVLSFSDRRPAGQFRRSKAIRSVNDNLRINRKLWDMATQKKELVNV